MIFLDLGKLSIRIIPVAQPIQEVIFVEISALPYFILKIIELIPSVPGKLRSICFGARFRRPCLVQGVAIAEAQF